MENKSKFFGETEEWALFIFVLIRKHKNIKEVWYKWSGYKPEDLPDNFDETQVRDCAIELTRVYHCKTFVKDVFEARKTAEILGEHITETEALKRAIYQIRAGLIFSEEDRKRCNDLVRKYFPGEELVFIEK